MTPPGTPFDRATGMVIARLRNNRGLSQAQFVALYCLAADTPWHNSTIAKVELGDRHLTLAEAYTVALVLGVRLDRLAEQAALLVRQEMT